MARKRAAERDLQIPLPKHPSRRLDALQDPELFLRTYIPEVFYEPFTEDRRDMLDSIIRAALYGGDQAIAGPRGEGKTKLAIYGSLYLMLAGLTPFPIVIGKSQSKAQSELKTVKEQLQQSPQLIEDFPEVCIPFQAVGGWSSRARMQTVGGTLTNIEIAADHLILPTIPLDRLSDDWPAEIEPTSNGQIIASLGVDGPVRGTNYRDRRPTLAIIDDIEDRKAAESDVTIAKNEEIIEQDIGGLGASAERISRVYLCTTQNRKCVAYRYTDPKQKPSWKGKRYRKMIRPPDRMDLVEQYIEMRTMRRKDDPDAREAHRFWKANINIIEAGAVISNPSSVSKKMHEDGDPLEWSAIQAYFNRVADMGRKAVATEIDNDPPEETGPQGNGLTAEIVASRLSGLDRLQLPANTERLTIGIDLGKYRCHWVAIAWWNGAGGCIVDYGIAEVTGTSTAMDNVASEPMVHAALLNWRDELTQKAFVDSAGQSRKVDAVFIDSGTFTDAAYEFVRQVGGAPFYVTKGEEPYHGKTTRTSSIVPGNHLHASLQAAQRLWLYILDTSFWKAFVHERFLTPTFDENNMLRRGALSLFTRNRGHLSFAQHIVAEQLVSQFRPGKGTKVYWDKVNDNNHWLDATYLACAAAGAHGINLLAKDRDEGPKVAPQEKQPQKKQVVQHGSPRFKQRAGGWINGIRRR